MNVLIGNLSIECPPKELTKLRSMVLSLYPNKVLGKLSKMLLLKKNTTKNHCKIFVLE